MLKNAAKTAEISSKDIETLCKIKYNNVYSTIFAI